MFSNLLSRLGGGEDAHTIDHAAFEEAVRLGSCVVVDVREPHEYASGRIPGSVSMPLSKFDPKALPVDKPVVLSCQSGVRSQKALMMAREAGREDVRHYRGGFAGWRARGGEVER
jgi:rhodanese-related sulfurtransferase